MTFSANLDRIESGQPHIVLYRSIASIPDRETDVATPMPLSHYLEVLSLSGQIRLVALGSALHQISQR